ncbi:MAG: carboxypeptidase-like regulatory domain-containing protein [Chitinophagaceae bacterium]|nr:carboxypeptidase-like regulatory domain-containing protein [Chitinophagaceae bacterium]
MPWRKQRLMIPSLADALEGYAVPGIDHTADLADLQARLGKRTSDDKVIPIGAGKSYGRWLRIAALFIFIAGSAALVYKMAGKSKDTGIAKTEETKIQPVITTVKDTANQIVKESTGATTTKVDAGTPVTATGNNDGPVKDKFKTPATSPVSTNQPAGEISSGGAVRDVTVTHQVQPVKDAEDRREDLAKKVAADEASKMETADMKTVPVNPSRKQQDKNLAVTTSPGNNNNYYKENNQNIQADNNQGRGFISNNQSQNTYRGRVTDNNNTGLPFARVTNSDDNNAGTYTDAQGNFNITYPDSVVNLQIRSVGFENTNIQLRSNNSLNRVVLQEEKGQNEVVISNAKPNAEARAKSIKQTLEEPEPADGWDNYDTYLVNNLNVPEEYRGRPTASNQVEVSFEVDKYGNPVNIKVEKSLCKTCDKEAIRLVKEGPKWKQHAKKGRTKITITFNTNL